MTSLQISAPSTPNVSVSDEKIFYSQRSTA
jgi:hypothetical protein